MRAVIFRVESEYGIRDYDSLERAKKCSKPTEHIQFVINEVEVLSRVKRNAATPAWAIKVAEKNGIERKDYKLFGCD